MLCALYGHFLWIKINGSCERSEIHMQSSILD